MAYTLRQAESETPVAEICRKLGISEQTFYRWKKKFAGMGVAELRRLRQVGDHARGLEHAMRNTCSLTARRGARASNNTRYCLGHGVLERSHAR